MKALETVTVASETNAMYGSRCGLCACQLKKEKSVSSRKGGEATVDVSSG